MVEERNPVLALQIILRASDTFPAFNSLDRCPCGRIGCLDACMSLQAMQTVAAQTVGVPPEDIDLDVLTRDAKQTRIPRTSFATSSTASPLPQYSSRRLIDPEILVLIGLETRINEIRPPARLGRTTTVRSQIGRDYHLPFIVALQQLDPDIAGLLRP